CQLFGPPECAPRRCSGSWVGPAVGSLDLNPSPCGTFSRSSVLPLFPRNLLFLRRTSCATSVMQCDSLAVTRTDRVARRAKIMPIVEDSIWIDASAEGLFLLSQDYALRRAWDPFVRAMRFQGSAREAAKGVRVWVRAWTGLSMEVEFVGFQPPHSVAMKMTSGPAFVWQFAGAWLFREDQSGRTIVTFRYFFTTRWRLLRPLIDPIIRWVFRRDVQARLRGLKRGAEELGLLDQLCGPCA